MDKKKRNLKRKINKRIRLINEALEKDELWRGRFVLLQKRSWIESYSDSSGVYGTFVIRIVDKKTNKYKDTFVDKFDILYKNLFWFINDFIAIDCKVWEENPKPGTFYAIEWKNIKPKALFNVGIEMLGGKR